MKKEKQGTTRITRMNARISPLFCKSNLCPKSRSAGMLSVGGLPRASGDPAERGCCARWGGRGIPESKHLVFFAVGSGQKRGTTSDRSAAAWLIGRRPATCRQRADRRSSWLEPDLSSRTPKPGQTGRARVILTGLVCSSTGCKC
jgi:hypothetical protein